VRTDTAFLQVTICHYASHTRSEQQTPVISLSLYLRDSSKYSSDWHGFMTKITCCQKRLCKQGTDTFYCTITSQILLRGSQRWKTNLLRVLKTQQWT